MTKWLKPILSFLVLGIAAGCGHTFYFESDTTGLAANIPFGEGTFRFMLGSSKTVHATIRGNTTFETSTTSGAGILAGAGGVAKVSRMSTNMQLNEGNVVKVLLSTNVADAAKIEIAKALTTAKAPAFTPLILKTANSTANVGTEAVSPAVVGNIDKTGVDLLVDKTPEVVHEVASVANNAIDSTEATLSNVVTNNAVAQLTHVPGQITGDVKEVVNNGVQVVGTLIGFIIALLVLAFLIWFIVFSCRKRKEVKSTAKHANIDDSNPASAEVQDPVVPIWKPTPRPKSRFPSFKSLFKIFSFIISLLSNAWFFISAVRKRKKKQ